MKFKFIGELPSGYEYKMFESFGVIKIVGIADDWSIICFIIETESLKLTNVTEELK